VRGGGEAIGARRQRPRQRTRPKQILVGLLGALEREEHAGKAAVSSGEEKLAARLRLEAGGVRERTRARIKALAQVAPGRRVNEGYRNRGDRVAAGKKHRMHRRAVPGPPC
jgi:hypothetical protein